MPTFLAVFRFSHFCVVVLYPARSTLVLLSIFFLSPSPIACEVIVPMGHVEMGTEEAGGRAEPVRQS
jgi:hypothetical protein